MKPSASCLKTGHLATIPQTRPEFRRFLQKEGAEGHCEGMAAVVLWTAAFDLLESTLA
ncbi:MAG: hypothetical protein JO179_10785 [Solirubrobacterales bacterium]|nr:hypothetical protein [Solirubrobacterales bacterium]